MEPHYDINVLFMLSTNNLLFNNEEDEDYEDIQEERNEIIRFQNYVENLLPILTDRQFQNHFRMGRSTFEKLLPTINNIIKKEHVIGRPTIDTDKQILATLWLLATPDSFRSVGERFNMGKSSLSLSFFRIVKALNILAPNIITWCSDLERNKKHFYQMARINGVIGAIDGTFIPIKAPPKDPEVYVTRKCNNAITLQGICDSSMRFMDCYVGYPGSVSDVRIFKNSDIYNNIIANERRYFPNGEFLLGDKAYPTLSFIISPYIDRGNLTNAKKTFNVKHSKTRQVIERAFALLFGRFRRLKYLDMNRTDLIPATVLASCVLHNICLDGDDFEIEELINEGFPCVLGNDEVPLREQNLHEQRGIQKRENLCRNLADVQ